MATKKKIEIPALDLSSSNLESRQLPTEKADVNQQILEQLIKMNEQLEKTYEKLYSTDWKIWKTMNIIEMIAKENGYEIFSSNSDNKE